MLRCRKKNLSKLKTKSGVKKRFWSNAAGRILMAQTGKRHGMRKRSQEMKRRARGAVLMGDSDAKIVQRNFIPYGLS